MEGWTKVYHSTEEYQAVIVKDLLEEGGLHPVIINQKDSEFPILGETKVFIAPEEEAQAKALIASRINTED